MEHPSNSEEKSVAVTAGTEATETTDVSKRRFTRNALVGGAVMLSLGNRSAWGQSVPAQCISDNTWTSYFNDGQYAFASSTPANELKANTAKIIRDADFVDKTSVAGHVCPGYVD